MYTIVILAVITLIIAIGMGIKTRDFFTVMCIVIGGVLGGLAVCTIADGVLTNNLSQIRVVEQKSNLASMHNDASLSGTFLFGSGSINQTPIYRMLVRNADGSVSPSSVTANESVKIFEDKSLDTTGTWTTTALRKVCPASLVVWMPFGCDNDGIDVKEEFHVPVGSVMHRFDVQ